MAKKRGLLNEKDGEATATQQAKKSKNNNDDDGKTTKRGGRSKNFQLPDGTASLRGKMSAKAQGKKTSKGKTFTEALIPMEDQENAEHERVVFIDNISHEPIIQLYRKAEAAEPMATLWSDFLRLVQLPRDHLGAQQISSILSKEESEAISLKNNANIFPTLITSKGALRSKDNYQASTTKAQRGEGGTFSRDAVTATGPDILRSRAANLTKKAEALKRQADAYYKTADSLAEDAEAPEDTPLGKHGMTYIGDVLPLSRKEVTRYIVDHEEHLTATAEKLRSEMAGLAAFVHRAEKRLRDQIQTKVAADLKLCRDVKKFGHFELKSWQIAALPSELHLCRCDVCTVDSDPFDNSRPPSVKLKYPEDIGLPQASQEDALPNIKVEDEDSGSLGTTIAQRGPNSKPDSQHSRSAAPVATVVTANPTTGGIDEDPGSPGTIIAERGPTLEPNNQRSPSVTPVPTVVTANSTTLPIDEDSEDLDATFEEDEAERGGNAKVYDMQYF